jgi:hypothetical protein
MIGTTQPGISPDGTALQGVAPALLRSLLLLAA